jgi:hypothetical protein
MNKKRLETVTLLGIDCVNIERLRLAMEICQNDFEFAEVKLLSSLPGDDVVKIDSINSEEEYSHFVIYELDKYVDTPHVLLIQYDGFILNPQAWTDELLNYDYIGAPWLITDWFTDKFDFPVELQGKRVVGNGGFSLRSKKLLSLTAKFVKERKLNRFHPEDIAICVLYRKLLEEEGIKFAPLDLAGQFSFESEGPENYSWNGQFGFHGLKWTDISLWSKEHPEYKIDNPASTEAPKN